MAFPVENGLLKEITKKGEGELVPDGHTVKVHYTGTLQDGKQFDSSRDGPPFEFTLGAGEVILGWDKGVATMKVGERAVFTVPPEYGYGEDGAPPTIPPNSTLIFDV
eukprot:g36867.t1